MLRLAVQLAVARFYLQTALNTIRGCGDWAKRTFLVRFAAVGATWFLLLPLTVGIATLLDPYLRAKAVVIMRLLVDGAVRPLAPPPHSRCSRASPCSVSRPGLLLQLRPVTAL